MKKLLISAALASLLYTPMAFADGGLAVGQDPYALAATKCSNNGGGNDGEYLVKGKCIKNTGAEDMNKRFKVCIKHYGHRHCRKIYAEELDPGNSGPATD